MKSDFKKFIKETAKQTEDWPEWKLEAMTSIGSEKTEDVDTKEEKVQAALRDSKEVLEFVAKIKKEELSKGMTYGEQRAWVQGYIDACYKIKDFMESGKE